MATEGNSNSDWRTALELIDPDHPTADATRFCESCESWTPHRMGDDGSYQCIPCDGADQEDIEAALRERDL
jgi:hypothetical protein